MIGLDTNVLVRYIVQDDARQAAVATQLIESSCTADSPGVIPLIVLSELVWVLDQGYGYSREQIAGVLRKMLSAEDLQVESAELAWLALNFYQKEEADFADYLIGLCAKEQKAEVTYTFDRKTSGCSLFKVLETR